MPDVADKRKMPEGATPVTTDESKDSTTPSKDESKDTVDKEAESIESNSSEDENISKAGVTNESNSEASADRLESSAKEGSNEKDVENPDLASKNAKTQTQSARRRRSTTRERLGSPLAKRRVGRSGCQSPLRRASGQAVIEEEAGERRRAAQSGWSDEMTMCAHAAKSCAAEHSSQRALAGSEPELMAETVRRIPSDTFAACHAAFRHSTPDEPSLSESVLLPLQAEASFEDSWVINKVPSILRSGTTSCLLSETIEERVASPTVLSMAGSSLCRILPRDNGPPRMKRNESSSSDSSSEESSCRETRRRRRTNRPATPVRMSLYAQRLGSGVNRTLTPIAASEREEM